VQLHPIDHWSAGVRPVVTTTAPHPFEANDWIAMGGTNTTYDGQWQVYSVPAIINPGATDEVDPTTFELVPKGTNYPESLGQGVAVTALFTLQRACSRVLA